METRNTTRAMAARTDEELFALPAELENGASLEAQVALYEARARTASKGGASRLLGRAAELLKDKDAARAEVLCRRARLCAPLSVEPLEGLKGLYERRQA